MHDPWISPDGYNVILPQDQLGPRISAQVLAFEGNWSIVTVIRFLLIWCAVVLRRTRKSVHLDISRCGQGCALVDLRLEFETYKLGGKAKMLVIVRHLLMSLV